MTEWHVDRGYIDADVLNSSAGHSMICKPWSSHQPGRISKQAFRFDFRRRLITCPPGKTTSLRLGATSHFDPEDCTQCELRALCTNSTRGRGVNVLDDEPRQVQLRRLIYSKPGRAKLRQRVVVEHRLAHHAQKQGRKARYVGIRNNVFDARRHAAVLNLELAHQEMRIAA